MKKLLLAALASAALTGTAFATEAFIGQVGNGHQGANIQLNQGQQSLSTAVIYQQQDPGGTNGHDALQVQLGDNNDAYTYQTSDFFDHIALSWQEGTGNDSVNVQITDGDTGSNDTPLDGRLIARTIQLGDNNSAVNWQSNAGGTTGLMSITPITPTLSVPGGNIGVAAPPTIVQTQANANAVPPAIPFSF